MKKIKQNQKGITLVALVLTIVLMIILTFTVTINVTQYKEHKAKSDFESDMNILQEEVNQYYARTKKIPIINKYTNTVMLTNKKNVNDNENYYILDLRQLEIKLKNGSEYLEALSRDRSIEISDLTDLYIINEQSHTIYYPKGVNYNGSIHYSLNEVYSQVKGEQII